MTDQCEALPQARRADGDLAQLQREREEIANGTRTTLSTGSGRTESRTKSLLGSDASDADVAGQRAGTSAIIELSPSKACVAPQSYTPALKNGKTVRGIGEIVVYYELQDPEPSLWSAVLGALIGSPKQQPAETPDWDICEKRPGDMISALPSSRG